MSEEEGEEYYQYDNDPDNLVKAVLDEDYNTLNDDLDYDYNDYIHQSNSIGLLPLAAEIGNLDMFRFLLKVKENFSFPEYDPEDNSFIEVSLPVINPNHEKEQLWQVFDARRDYLPFVKILIYNGYLTRENIQNLFDAAIHYDYQNIVEFLHGQRRNLVINEDTMSREMHSFLVSLGHKIPNQKFTGQNFYRVIEEDQKVIRTVATLTTINPILRELPTELLLEIYSHL